MHRSFCLMLLVLASGCAAQDPFQRPATWSPPNSNDENLRAMVANPNDLTVGVDQPGAASAEAAPPVARLLSGRRTPLLTSTASQIGATSGPAASPAAAAGLPQ